MAQGAGTDVSRGQSAVIQKAAAPRKRISRLHDARAVRSRAALREALLALIVNKPFEQISIKEITEQAGVSLPVFYRQFATREQLLSDIATDEIRTLLARSHGALERPKKFSALNEMCKHVYDNRQLWKTLLTAGASSAMREEFSRIAIEIGRTRPRANPWLPLDLATTFVVNGIFDILAWWLRQAEDYPIENVVKLLDVLVIRSTARPLDLTLE